MKRNRSFWKVFSYIFMALIVLFGGSRSSAYIWNKTFGKIDIETKIPTQWTADYEYLIAGSKSQFLVPSQPRTPIDLSFQPKVLNLKSNNKFIYSWVRFVLPPFSGHTEELNAIKIARRCDHEWFGS